VSPCAAGDGAEKSREEYRKVQESTEEYRRVQKSREKGVSLLLFLNGQKFSQKSDRFGNYKNMYRGF
jgi:hypothetical protein